MKVKDLIAKLQTFDPELPVMIADWNEGWSSPSEKAAELVKIEDDYPKLGRFVCIGEA